MADTADAKAIRRSSEVEGLLRQFLKMETGLGKNAAYVRGHEFNFEWPQEWRDAVFKLMEYGMSFEEAFDYWKALPEDQRGPRP